MRRLLASLWLLLACTPAGRPDEGRRDGIPSLAERASTLARSSDLQDVVQIESADAGTCALTSAGTVYCWGLVARSDDGPPYAPLFGRYQARPIEVPTGGRAPVTEIAMGTYALAAVDASGRLLMAGDFGLLVVQDGAEAPPDTPFVRTSRATQMTNLDPQRVFRRSYQEHLYTRRLVPTDVENVTSVGAQGSDICWMGPDRVVHCNSGEPSFLGSSKTYDPVNQFIDPHAPTCVATGTRLNCDGEGPRDLPAVPTRLESDGRWEACILLADRSLRCSEVEAPGPFVDIALAIHRGVVCGARGDGGRVSCYSLTGESEPTSIRGTEGVVELAAGTQHLCGRRRDSTVVCWGHGDGGRLGGGILDEDERHEARPVVAPGPGTPEMPRSTYRGI